MEDVIALLKTAEENVIAAELALGQIEMGTTKGQLALAQTLTQRTAKLTTIVYTYKVQLLESLVSVLEEAGVHRGRYMFTPEDLASNKYCWERMQMMLKDIKEYLTKKPEEVRTEIATLLEVIEEIHKANLASNTYQFASS